MTQMTEHRYDVAFSASQAPDGRPVIALVLSQDGQAAAGQDNIFFLEPNQTIGPEAAPRIAEFLNKYISGFGVMVREQEKT
jgi:hypothetical protein